MAGATLAADAAWTADGQGQVLTAPTGATSALITIRAMIAKPGSLPVIAADDVEFAEVR